MAERSRFDQKCKDCGHSDFVEDRAAGDLICQVPIGNCRGCHVTQSLYTLRLDQAGASNFSGAGVWPGC